MEESWSSHVFPVRLSSWASFTNSLQYASRFTLVHLSRIAISLSWDIFVFTGLTSPQGDYAKCFYIASSRIGPWRGHGGIIYSSLLLTVTWRHMCLAMWRQSHSQLVCTHGGIMFSVSVSVHGTSLFGLRVWCRGQHLQDVQCLSLVYQLSPGIFLNDSSRRVSARERPFSIKSASS